MCELPEKARLDVFRPPSVPTEVFCLHCQREYSSYLIHWCEEIGDDGAQRGFWCCPTPGCTGIGFGFDIFPIDPDYVDEHTGEKMWFFDDDDEWDDEDEQQWIMEQVMYPAEYVIEGVDPPCTGLPDIGLTIGHEPWIEHMRIDAQTAVTAGDDHRLAAFHRDSEDDIPF